MTFPHMQTKDNESIALPLEVEVGLTELEVVTDQPLVPKAKAKPKTKTEKEQRLADLAKDTRYRLKRSALDIYHIGVNLLEAQSITEHGEFLPWLEQEFGMGKTSAYEFIHVAKAFQSKFPIIGSLINAITPTALYKLAAPSSPEAARAEAIERVKAGEVIGLDIAKDLVKKHKASIVPKTQQPKASPIAPQRTTNQVEAPALPESKGSQPEQATSNLVALPPTNLEIVAISPTAQVHAPTTEIARVEATSVIVPQPSQLASAPDVAGVWWRLDGRHLLYCGNPNSDEFLTQIPEKVQLLLAFPPANIWQSRITAEARIILNDYMSVFYNPELLDEVLEKLILSTSRPGDVVVTCYLPSPKILFIVNRLNRWGLFAEPNSRRCKAIIAHWKRMSPHD